ncbi:hypothetical protein C1645_839526 [Glomus cerebriforme]|uniref:Uncharacterized protein n=1 Tax=Glomus cerebriforme TaxID=658196 RepID=A0A397S6L1_9GLOM|nr:hypothetical protein C1645_839526 [Glomus cerebriforme]
MNDIDSMSSDDSDTEYFPEDLLDNIPEDSDYDSNEEDNPKNNSTNTDLGSSPLELKVNLTFPIWNNIYKKSLQSRPYKVIYKYHQVNLQLGNDVSWLFEYLEKLKEEDSHWIIYKDWNHETNTLTKIFWINPD